MELIETYSQTIYAQGTMALVMLIQVLISDILGIRAKHAPGSPVNSDHACMHGVSWKGDGAALFRQLAKRLAV